MIRGTNAGFKFKIPCNYSDLDAVTITFWQANNNGPSEDRPLPIIKVLEQCSQTDAPNELYVELNEEETLRFNDDRKAYVQMLAVDINGTTTASKKKEITVYPIYDDSLLNDGIVPTPDDVPIVTIVVDTALSNTSENPVQNKVIKAEFDEIYNQLSSNIIPNLMPSVTTDDENKILQVVDGKWMVVEHENTSNDIEVDTTLSIPGMAADAKTTGDKINELSSQIADILYQPINITSFTNNIGTVEIGSTLDNITLSWSINKTPTTLTLDPQNNNTLNLSANGKVELTELGITSTTTWKLAATDERKATSTKSTTVNFYNGVYYGSIDGDVIIDNTVILGLTRKLQGSKTITFSTTANSGQFIIYALPVSYDIPAFNVGGFDGGFNLYATINFINSSGYEELYNIYRSDNHSLGATTVKVI